VQARSQLVEVEARLHQIEREATMPDHDVILKRVEPLLVASVRAILPTHSAVGALFGEVYDAIRPYVGEALYPLPEDGGQTLVLWYDAEFKERDFDGAAAFMLRCRVPDRGRVRVHELPAATVAATIHHGSYDTMGDAHEAVIRWIDANGYRVVGPDRELNLHHTMPIRQDNPTYVTEIQYPVDKTNGDEGK
jgi:effector-binding domain-containing protein